MNKNGIGFGADNSNLVAIFQSCEDECRQGLIPWLQTYGWKKNPHNKYQYVKNENLHKVKATELLSLFANLPLWERSSQASGHCKFKHRVTNITISFEGHTGSKNTSYIPENHAKALRDAIQDHVNILGNEFFKESWSKCEQFNHKAAAERYRLKMVEKNNS